MVRKEQLGTPEGAAIVHDFARTDGLSLTDGLGVDGILTAVEDKSLVLLGKESHGTRDYYHVMADITKRLITEQGHQFVAIEWDWSDSQKLNTYIHEPDADQTAIDILTNLNRAPHWMWGNEEFLGMVEWLREHNLQAADVGQPTVSLYGIDCQEDGQALFDASLTTINDTVTDFDLQVFGKIEGEPTFPTPERVSDILVTEAENSRPAIVRAQGKTGAFITMQGLQTAITARRYETTEDWNLSWNLRVQHYYDTLKAIRRHHGPRARGTVWAHNTHVGDDRGVANRDGSLNLGELIKKGGLRDETFLLGMGSESGTVLAANVVNPEAIGEIIELAPASADSWHATLSESRPGENYVLVFNERAKKEPAFRESRDQRVVGMFYWPEKTIWYRSQLGRRFDGYVHFSETAAVTPLPGIR